jgi:4-hydroxybenzoate polyprenyltransferase
LVRALVRLVHPFPSALDAAATAALVLLAGGSPSTALVLGCSMLAIQFSIGALNDAVDAPRDATLRPGKPVAAGLVPVRTAVAIAVGGSAVGLALAATQGAATLVVAGAGLATGLAYDLRLKATPLSWLPFAVGVPLIPVFAWVGATGAVPPAVAVLALLAVPAGAGLAIANALADIPADAAAGTRTVATRLGPTRSWLLATALLAGTFAAAALTLVAAGAGPGVTRAGSGDAGAQAAGTAAWVAIGAGLLLLVVGAALGRGPDARRRRLGWGTEALSLAVLACGWIAALLGAGLL